MSHLRHSIKRIFSIFEVEPPASSRARPKVPLTVRDQFQQLIKIVSFATAWIDRFINIQKLSWELSVAPPSRTEARSAEGVGWVVYRVDWIVPQTSRSEFHPEFTTGCSMYGYDNPREYDEYVIASTHAVVPVQFCCGHVLTIDLFGARLMGRRTRKLGVLASQR